VRVIASALDVDQSIAHRDEMLIDKSTGAQSAYAKGVLIASAAWRGVVACSDGASSSPSSLQRASAKLISSQDQFLDGRKRRWKHKPGHRLGHLAGLLIPYLPFPPPQSSPWPPGNLSTTPTPFVTAPPTNVSRTMDFGGGRCISLESLSHVRHLFILVYGVRCALE
jgi:hypothetical protein